MCIFGIFKVIADIFNRPVYTRDVPNSAPLGGCYRAKLGTNTSINYYRYFIKVDTMEKICSIRV